MSAFPVTSVTLIAKIKDLGPERDSAEWVRFWDSYSLAIRNFAALKGGEENADDIVMAVLGKLVDVLRDGRYVPEKGRFHSYLATMIVNEVRMAHRRESVRGGGMKVSLDAQRFDDGESTFADTIAAPEISHDEMDADWRKAVLQSAVEHVLTRTALSERDRAVYRAYVQQELPIAEVAEKFGLSRNSVSQIKTRIERRIIAFGRELVEREDGLNAADGRRSQYGEAKRHGQEDKKDARSFARKSRARFVAGTEVAEEPQSRMRGHDLAARRHCPEVGREGGCHPQRQGGFHF